MMEKKILASGFPEGIDQATYIRECKEMFGIELDPRLMHPNAAMRIIAKLMNNNLWGRFSLRNGLCKTTITDCPARLRKMLEDESIDVIALDVLSPTHIMITYEPQKEYIEENASSNLMLSLWVTSAARIHLLHALQKVANTPGAVLLYSDTDSIVFAFPKNQPCPLTTGPHLGMLTDEYPGFTILEWLSGGCKNYALRMVDNNTGEEKTVLRVRGITLSADVCQKLHFQTMKESVFKYAKTTTCNNNQEGSSSTNNDGAEGEMPMETNEDEEDFCITTVNTHFIQPNVKTGTIITRPMQKYYRPIITKGIVDGDMIIRDFGST
jgi:hypothetical protein